MKTCAALVALAIASASAASPAALLRAGRQEARAGSWAKADDLFLRAEDGARLLDDATLELAARLARIDLRLTAEEPDSAAALLPALPKRAIPVADSAVWHLARARVALAKDDLPTAREASLAAHQAADRGDERPLRSVASVVLGRALLAGGDLDGATRAWKDARRRADDVPALEASAASLEARLELARNRPIQATTAIERSLSLWRVEQDVGGILGALPLRAQVASAQGDSAAARETWDAAAHIAERTGLPRGAVRACLMAGAASPAAAATRQARAREILKASGLPSGQLAPDLQALLR